MSTQPRVVSPFPYAGGVVYTSGSSGGGGSGAPGIWYAYFENTTLANDGQPKVISIAGIGTSGNGSLFTSLADGVKVASNVIVQATAWGVVNNPEPEDKWLGIQLDKQGALLVRAHTAFNQKAANITYGGVLAPDDILRVVGGNSAAAEDSVLEGWVSVIASPI